ncbi:MAG: hypothetical protein IPK04_10690 [Bdellovibrionales bacterium]|nr:hypothetical protein [Bdellovibrionales bacterium]
MVEVGSDLLEGPMARFDANKGQEAKTSAPVKILSGMFGNRVSIFGRNSYVFLNSGKAQGVEVGKILPVFKNQAAHVKATTVEMLPGQIGKIKIIAADQNHSTGYVISNLELIRRGDWVGFPGITISENSLTSAVSRQDTAENLDSDFNEAFENTFGHESDQVKADQDKSDQDKSDQVKSDQDQESPEGESKTSESLDEIQL